MQVPLPIVCELGLAALFMARGKKGKKKGGEIDGLVLIPEKIIPSAYCYVR